MIEYLYRKLIPMSHDQFLSEPADVVYLTLVIENKIKAQEARVAKWQQRT